ncbi:hypothetical protein [Polymorphospora sp. NPDC050346]|uniref:hypothetical protein n=1 Tax=Polymorphospora sp. NPDC050346 TaxID=3155780 RepID=UPI0033E2C8D3
MGAAAVDGGPGQPDGFAGLSKVDGLGGHVGQDVCAEPDVIGCLRQAQRLDEVPLRPSVITDVVAHERDLAGQLGDGGEQLPAYPVGVRAVEHRLDLAVQPLGEERAELAAAVAPVEIEELLLAGAKRVDVGEGDAAGATVGGVRVAGVEVPAPSGISSGGRDKRHRAECAVAGDLLPPQVRDGGAGVLQVGGERQAEACQRATGGEAQCVDADRPAETSG